MSVTPKFSHALPPLPWSYQTTAPKGAHDGNGLVNILDSNGRKIGVLWGTPDQKLAIAELICDASDAAHEAQKKAAAA